MKKFLSIYIFFCVLFAGRVFSQDASNQDVVRNIKVNVYLDQIEKKRAQELTQKVSPVKYEVVPAVAEKPAEVKKAPKVKTDSLFSNTTTSFNTGVISQQIYGDSNYRIEFTDHLDDFGIDVNGASELNFPIRGYFAGARLTWQEKLRRDERKDLIRFTLDWYTHIYNNSSQMRDSDWFEDPFHAGRDIYSESNCDMGGYGIDARLVWNMFSLGDNIFTGPMLGYKYQHFNFSCRDLEQIGYGVFAPYYTSNVSGAALEYEVKNMIPYIGWSADILFTDDLSLNTALGYSFYAVSQDVDDHVLRYKRSTGDCQGHALLADMAVNWDINALWSFTTGVQYLHSSTSGRQIQTFYAGPYTGTVNNLDMQINTDQIAVNFVLSYKF